MYLMGFDRNRSLQNLKFYFEIKIFSHYEISVLVGGLTSPPGGKYPLGMVIFQDECLSKELISTSKTNGSTIHLEQFYVTFNSCYVQSSIALLNNLPPM